MTNEEHKDIVQMFGPNYKREDIPAFIRKRDAEDTIAEERKQEEIRRREKSGVL